MTRTIEIMPASLKVSLICQVVGCGLREHVGKKGSGPKSAEHPQGRSGFRDLTPFSNDAFQEAVTAARR